MHPILMILSQINWAICKKTVAMMSDQAFVTFMKTVLLMLQSLPINRTEQILTINGLIMFKCLTKTIGTTDLCPVMNQTMVHSVRLIVWMLMQPVIRWWIHQRALFTSTPMLPCHGHLVKMMKNVHDGIWIGVHLKQIHGPLLVHKLNLNLILKQMEIWLVNWQLHR